MDAALGQAVTGLDPRGRPEGRVVEVLERNTRQVVGRLFCESGVGFVLPDNKRLTHEVVIPEKDCAGIQSGQMVVAEIVEQPTPHSQPVGRVLEVLGEHMAPGMEIDVAIRAAVDTGTRIDLHVDETLDPSVLTLRELAHHVIDSGFDRAVTASHCVSLGMQTADVQAAVARLVADAGIAVVTLPQTNLFLQGRGRPTATPRGLTALDAAAMIHSDLAEGFIKTDVVNYDDLRQAGDFVHV